MGISCFIIAGFSFSGAGQNTGLAFTHLKDWDQRKGASNSAQAVAQRAFGAFMRIRDAQIYPLVPPSVQELGQSAGFDLFLEDRANIGHAALMQRATELATTIANHAPLTMRATKEAMRRLTAEAAQGVPGDDLVTLCYTSEDFREGMEAFLAKRPPVWRGR